MTDLEKVFEGKFIVPDSVVNSLMFFKEKYKNRNVYSINAKQAIGDDLYLACKVIFNSAEFCKVIRIYRNAAHLWTSGQVPKRIDLQPCVRFIKLIDDLENFYELNGTCVGAIKDRRIPLFCSLKGRMLNSIRFLNNRTKEVTGPVLPKIMKTGKQPLGNRRKDIDKSSKAFNSSGRLNSVTEEAKLRSNRWKSGL